MAIFNSYVKLPEGTDHFPLGKQMVSGAAEVQLRKHRSEGHSGGAQDKNQIPSFLSAIECHWVLTVLTALLRLDVFGILFWSGYVHVHVK